MTRTPARLPRVVVALAWALLLALALAPAAAAQNDRYGERDGTTHIVDEARVITGATESSQEEVLDALQEETGIDIVIYTQRRNRVGARKAAQEEAQALLEQHGDKRQADANLWIRELNKLIEEQRQLPGRR